MALGRYDAGLEVLELGNAPSMDDDELRALMQMVLPARLDSVRELYLGFMDMLTDSSVQALAGAGCGSNLRWLTLQGE